jgi:hypothetical protein
MNDTEQLPATPAYALTFDVDYPDIVVGDLADRLVREHFGMRLSLSVVSGSSGQPGAAVAYPASSKTSRHGSQLLGRSQRP